MKMNSMMALSIVWVGTLAFVAYMVTATGNSNWGWCLLVLLFFSAESKRTS